MSFRRRAVLPDFIHNRLKPMPADLPPQWQLWQHKTLNLHRGILHWDATSSPVTLDQIQSEVRSVVRECFCPSWWRGFGFGAIVSLADADDSFGRVVDLVDARNNGKGTWQWIVLHFPESQAAFGICTWTEGYLAPVYRDLIAAFQAAGIICDSHKKDMDAVMKTLLTIQKHLRTAKRVLGAVDGFTPS